jgi:hypothetical protein
MGLFKNASRKMALVNYSMAIHTLASIAETAELERVNKQLQQCEKMVRDMATLYDDRSYEEDMINVTGMALEKHPDPKSRGYIIGFMESYANATGRSLQDLM